MQRLEDIDLSIKSRLKALENETVASLKYGLTDVAHRKIIESVVLSRILYGEREWRHAQYITFLASSYLLFKGPSYAAQAEQHAEQAKQILLSYATCLHGMVQYETQDDQVQRKAKALLLVIFLTYYLLAQTKYILKKFRDALHFATKAECTLDELKLSDTTSEDKQDFCFNQSKSSKLRSSDSSEYDLLDMDDFDHGSILLTPGGGFFPSLSQMSVRMLMLLGRIMLSLGKYSAATDYFEKALSIVNEFEEEDSAQKIAIYNAMAQVEQNKNPADFGEAAEILEKSYKITKKKLKLEDTLDIRLEVARAGNLLCSACLAADTPSYTKKAEEFATEAFYLITESNGEQRVEAAKDNTTQEELISVSKHVYDVEANRDAYLNADSRLVDCACQLRSILIKIYLGSDRHQEAVKLLKQNLRSQQITHGLYSADAVNTQKLLLSTSLAMGEYKDSIKQAKECLSLEEFTFGTKSKQACKTREILETLQEVLSPGPPALHPKAK
ncbi:unnamed protein product [Calicophoron daubneyi]|uniref:Tetratricopeptide repeat protein 23 n=1 Tax=Calicophoron daubneyi TaxID=300641 RepID=A0AAV2TXY1_CALDB